MPGFPSETSCFYAKAATKQCLSFLPLASHHRGTTTNFPFSPRATAAEMRLSGYMRKTMNEGRGGAFFQKDIPTPVHSKYLIVSSSKMWFHVYILLQIGAESCGLCTGAA